MSWFDSLKRELDCKSLEAKTKQKQTKAKTKTEAEKQKLTELDYFIDCLLKYKQHDDYFRSQTSVAYKRLVEV